MGSACVFPFKFRGVSHMNCTTIDGDKAWCSTKTDENNNHIKGGWGYCPANCSAGSGSGYLNHFRPVFLTSCSRSTDCKAVGPGGSAECVFPFKFNGVSHSGCTTSGGYKPWCSTKTDANNNHVSGVDAWGTCDATCPMEGC